MDLISQLPDAVLLVILSLLPAKDVVATMVLSKRWQFLWMLVPRLVYDDNYQNIEYGRFSRFVDRSLLLHEAPTLKTLHFKLGQISGAIDIGVWTKAVLKRCLPELIIEIDFSSSTNSVILPRSLYTCCTMLVTLKLNSIILVDFSSPVSFPFLKEMSLDSIKYPGDEFFKRLLSSCHVLEDLVVVQCGEDNVTVFTVRVPSLKKFCMHKSLDKHRDGADGFVIDAPSLESLEILDNTDGFCVIENEMPNIVTADVDVTHSHSGNILTSIISDAYPVGSVFNHLVDLTLCRCDVQWLNLLMRLLGDSPKLRALRLDQYHGFQAHEPSPCWIKPSSIPKCLSSSFETLEWEAYEGTEEEKELVGYILRNGSCLKKVTVSSKSTDSDKKLEMI
ncbi:unnamed protein product, partial [Arabidopsis halleri]